MQTRIQSTTLHDVPATERPRERLQRNGVQSLAANELLALILGMGTAGYPVMKTSGQLLQRFGDLQSLSKASWEELTSVAGLGPAKASRLLACLELARRVAIEKELTRHKRQLVQDPSHLANYLRHTYDLQQQEHYWVVSLTSRNHIISVDAVSVGIIDAALVHPRETFAMAMRRRACKIIVCHNHPSGDCKPSEDDLLITKRLLTAGKIVGIPVIDHLIVTMDDYYSWHQQGQLGAKNQKVSD